MRACEEEAHKSDVVIAATCQVQNFYYYVPLYGIKCAGHVNAHLVEIPVA